MARRYIDNIEIVDSFDAIPWTDILLRRVRLISVPGKPEAHSKRELRKRKAVKLLCLSISGELGKVNFEDCLLNEHGSEVIFVPAQTIVLIYQRHLHEGFKVLELKDELHKGRMKAIAKKAEHARELGILDEKPGLTVFTNVREDTILRAYKKIHPNRRIVLRFTIVLMPVLASAHPTRSICSG